MLDKWLKCCRVSIATHLPAQAQVRIAQLEAELDKKMAELSKKEAELDKKEAELDETEAALKLEHALRVDAEWKLKQLANKYFGSSSEKIDPAQLQLLLEGIEAEAALGDSHQDEEGKGDGEGRAGSSRGRKRSSFPEEMIEKVVEILLPEDKRCCPDTGAELKIIRWEETTKYNYVPGHFERVLIRRAVYAPAKPVEEEGEDTSKGATSPITAEMPAAYRAIPGCMAAPGLLAYILTAKYCDHLPLYRIAGMFRRSYGVDINRTTMCHWVKRCADILAVLYEAMRRELLSGNYLQIDETFVKMLDPETKGKAKRANLWVIKVPDGGVLFRFDPSRAHAVAMDMLEGFEGSLQSDGYSVYQTLLGKVRNLTPFYCWAHVRRKFVEALEANGSDAAWYVAKIQKLYRIEERARNDGLDHGGRTSLRQREAQPILLEIKARLDRDLGNPEVLPSSPLGKAVRYALPLWAGLQRYTEAGHGMVEIDNNLTENAIRPTAVGKKNWLFIGHPKAGQTSAIIYTMVENCRMWDIDPLEYFADVLPRVMDHTASKVAELLPKQWKQARVATV